MGVSEIIFWVSLIILIYTYVGYMLLLLLFSVIKKKIKHSEFISHEKNITLIVPAFNEGNILQEKINNCLALEYNYGKVDLVFCIDGSTDESRKILEKYSNIKIHDNEMRVGKIQAINNAMKEVTTAFVIFSDANTLLSKNALKELMQHFSNEKVGAVAGEKRVLLHQNSIVGLGEGYYWKYESYLKLLNAKLFSVVGAAGELFCIKTNLFKELPNDTILDDFMLSMEVIKQNYILQYEPNAFATETPSFNINEEYKRRVRIAAGSFQALHRLIQSFPFAKYPLFSFQLFSQKFFRWVLSPLALIALFFSSFIIYTNQPTIIQFVIVLLWFLFLSSFIGYFFNKFSKKSYLIFSIPYYFIFMNASLISGFFKYISGKQNIRWDKSLRI